MTAAADGIFRQLLSRDLPALLRQLAVAVAASHSVKWPPCASTPDRPAPEFDMAEGPVAEGVNIFRGWMFASSPALNPLEHAVYDVWVIDCETRVIDN